MVAETAKEYERLERQAQKLMGVFAKRGYEHVAPASLQPADVFLDVVGESLRARTYVFTDPDGDELCLRPDLTVPTCRLHIERHPTADVRARYAYNGSAFRFQPMGENAIHPREFRQAGIESFAVSDKEKAEADIVVHTQEALLACGLEDFKLRFGDLGLFKAVLGAIDMPKRWRRRLRSIFWRPDAFRKELQRLVSAPAQAVEGLPAELVSKIDPEDIRGAENVVAHYLADQSIEFIGARSISEVADNICSAVLDAGAQPLSPEQASTIESYVSVKAPSKAAGARLKDLMRERDVDISEALTVFKRRLDLLADAGVDIAKSEFSAEFGRALDYYTGFVFEIETPVLGPDSPLAGGGRYDKLLKDSGAPFAVPAVGAAIHTERLLETVSARDSSGDEE